MQRPHRLLERRVRVRTVRVEDVDVVEPEALQRLVERREEVLARAAVAVRPGPHVPAGLGADDQLVAVRPEVLREQPTDVLLCGAVRRAVVVREIEVGDAEIECPARYGALGVERPVATEVLPEPQRHRR
jgi:hypothetical protein